MPHFSCLTGCLLRVKYAFARGLRHGKDRRLIEYWFNQQLFPFGFFWKEMHKHAGNKVENCKVEKRQEYCNAIWPQRKKRANGEKDGKPEKCVQARKRFQAQVELPARLPRVVHPTILPAHLDVYGNGRKDDGGKNEKKKLPQLGLKNSFQSIKITLSAYLSIFLNVSGIIEAWCKSTTSM